jgi:WD40 repeat protein
MAWPTAQDYDEAVQNPHLNFQDAELKDGQVELYQRGSRRGLPRPRSGNFATVYRMQCGQRNWAVRCFTSKVTDQQKRYAAISEYFARLKRLGRIQLPYMVDFEFLEKGIKVNGQGYPILKMEWVEGELLDKFIKKHLRNSTILRHLAKRWVTMIQTLESAGIAHGDLQHGNILILNNGELKLIDYDGMFVPALSDFSSNEVGHYNYQHPSRTGNDFRANIDRFSAWVIYIALISLSIDPNLWPRVGAGDEFILLRKKDFEQPDTSATLALLAQHNDVLIQSLVTKFKQLLRNPAQIPPLTTIHTASTSSDWLSDHLPQQKKQKKQKKSSSFVPSPSISVKPTSHPVKHKIRGKKWLTPRLVVGLLTIGLLIVMEIVLLSTSWQKAILLTNEAPSNELLYSLIHESPVSSVSFNSTGSILVSNNKLWDMETGKLLHTLTGSVISFNPDGRILVASLDSKIKGYNGYYAVNEYTLKLQEVGNNKYKQLYIGKLSRTPVEFSPDGNILATLGETEPGVGHTIRLLEVKTGKLLQTFRPVQGIKGSISFSPDGNILTSEGSDFTIKLWNTKTGKLLHTLVGYKAYISSIAFNPNGTMLASQGGYDGSIKLWEVKTGKLLNTIISQNSSFNPNFPVSFSPDGKTLASGSDDGTIYIWDVSTGKQLRKLTGHQQSKVNSVSFSPDGQILASGGEDETVNLWSLNGFTNIFQSSVENFVINHSKSKKQSQLTHNIPLTIHSNTYSTKVFINRKYYGYAPLNYIELPVGLYTVRVEGDDYNRFTPLEKQINLQKADYLFFNSSYYYDVGL